MKAQYIMINEYGSKFYYKDKKMVKLHRLDGPAIEYNNSHKEWYINGKLHREDGPAVVWPNGSKFWYLYGKQIYYYFAKEFNEHAAEVVLTMDEIAAKFGVDVRKLKITK